MAYKNWRVRPRDGQRYPVQIVGEIYTIEFHTDNNTWGFYLKEAPVFNGVSGTPITVKLNNSAQTLLSETSRNQAPSSLQYVVDYDEPTYFATGFVECNSAQANEEVIVDSWGLGAVVHSDNIAGILADESIPGSLTIEDDLTVGGDVNFSGNVLNAIPRIAVFTASGTWTVPAGVTKCCVKVIGAGGGGGPSVSTGGSPGSAQLGGSGGGGGISEKRITGLTPGDNIAITVGTGGIAGAISPLANGGDGGSSSFGAYCSATGGTGGGKTTPPDSAKAGLGGVGSSGDLNYSLGDGQAGARYDASVVIPGVKGGGPGGAGNILSAGSDGRLYGGGGASGAGDPASGNDYAGGAGANGVVIIYY